MKISLFGFTVLLFAGAGCSRGAGANEVVGAACTGDQQCANECIADDTHYPGGFCTAACTSNAMCPSGTVCIADHGGMCAIPCQYDYSCALCETHDVCHELGPTYRCDSVMEQGSDASVVVCRAP